VTLPGAPAGWKELPSQTGFIGVNGPLYGRLVDGKLEMGFRVEARHCNPIGACHGGMLMTFADMVLGVTGSFAVPESGLLPTISIAGDFIAAVSEGDWVACRGEVLRVTRNLVFLQGALTANDVPCLRWNGILKITRGERSFDFGKWLER
jgi:uncharacterized protein (TIGR00369 family)